MIESVPIHQHGVKVNFAFGGNFSAVWGKKKKEEINGRQVRLISSRILSVLFCFLSPRITPSRCFRAPCSCHEQPGLHVLTALFCHPLTKMTFSLRIWQSYLSTYSPVGNSMCSPQHHFFIFQVIIWTLIHFVLLLGCCMLWLFYFFN